MAIRHLIFGRGEITDRLKLVDWSLHINFKLEDMWVGVYWEKVGHALDIWVCLIPCVPFHLSIIWTDPLQ